MPVPRLYMPDHNVSDVDIKADRIVQILYDMGYDVGDERDVVRVIEKEGVDKFDFDYPYGSFEEFKRHVLDGEFDVDLHLMTDEEREQWDKDEKEGRVWITY